MEDRVLCRRIICRLVKRVALGCSSHGYVCIGLYIRLALRVFGDMLVGVQDAMQIPFVQRRCWKLYVVWRMELGRSVYKAKDIFASKFLVLYQLVMF